MASKIPKKYCISVKRLQRNLLIWYSDMPETANGHITLLELNLSHIMVRTESTNCKNLVYFFSEQKSLGIRKGLLHQFKRLSKIPTSFW